MEGRRRGGAARMCHKWKNFFRYGCCAYPWSIPLASSSSSSSIIPATNGDRRPGVHPDNRQYYSRGDQLTTKVEPTAARVTLERLLLGEGSEGEEEEEQQEDVEEYGIRSPGGGWWCCVCMRRRKKGAAFISCGHTFCRDCARELLLRRGSCPLCNRAIIDILDIY